MESNIPSPEKISRSCLHKESPDSAVCALGHARAHMHVHTHAHTHSPRVPFRHSI